MTVLTADIGTSSLKAALVTEDGLVLSACRVPFILYGTDHAATEWLPAFNNAVKMLNTSQKPEAVCISGNGPTVVGSGGSTLLWNRDISSLINKDDFTPSLFLPRIQAFKILYPKEWENSDFILSGPEYLIYELTGKAVTILPEERYKSAYWKEGEKFFGRGFPKFVFPGTQVGRISIKNHPLEGLSVFSGAPDFVAALAGTATLKPGMLCDRAGSSEGLNLCTEKPLCAKGIRTLPSLTKNLWNASVLLSDTGVRFESYRKLVERTEGKTVSHKEIVHALLFKSDAIKDDSVLKQGRKLIEEISIQVKEAVELLTREAEKEKCTLPTFMTVTGGQASNMEWNAHKEKVTGLTVKTPSCTDAELIGDAVFAFTGLKRFSSFAEAANHLCRSKTKLGGTL